VGNEGPDAKDSEADKLNKLRYDGELRCFQCAGSAGNKIPVLPCRYSTYIAVKMSGKRIGVHSGAVSPR
jgi:hypothetical protein